MQTGTCPVLASSFGAPAPRPRESDARRFLDEMRERLAKFALTLHPEKTRIIEFGRFAAERRERRGLGKPETFNFLGFSVLQRHMERSSV